MLFVILLFLNWGLFTEEIYKDPKSFPLREIAGGASNKNYLFKHEGKSYFIRFAPETATLLGADIEIENEVLRKLQGLSIAPKPVYYNPEKRILVTEYIDHEEGKIDLADGETRRKVFAILHEVEALHLKISRVYTPYSSICRLIDKVYEFGDKLAPEFIASLPLLKKIDKELSTLPQDYLSHRDLHHGNILKGKKGLVLIDWEFAAMSHPFSTLASMASGEMWDDTLMREALKEFDESATEEDFYFLTLYRILADSYWYVWCRLQTHLSPIDEYSYTDSEAIFLKAALLRMPRIR